MIEYQLAFKDISDFGNVDEETDILIGLLKIAQSQVKIEEISTWREK